MYTFDGAVDVGALDVELGLVVGGEVGSASEEGVPVGRVEVLPQDVVHALALLSQLARRADVFDEGGSICC